MPYPVRDLTGSVVAITGATAGIGAAAANQLVEAGAKVVLGGRREEPARRGPPGRTPAGVG